MTYSTDKLYKKYVCRNHFVDLDLSGPKNIRLIKTAIPKIYNFVNENELKVITPLRVFKNKTQTMSIESLKLSTKWQLFSSQCAPKNVSVN